jgi:glycosyltransferase involved in cell wall biosynthesis
MKINLFDTGLSTKGGHHFDFNRTLMRALADARHEAHLYGPLGTSDEVVDALAPYGAVSRLLRPYQYADLEPVEHYAAKLDTFMRKSAMLAEDLRDVAEADLWIWPSMVAFDLQAVALSGTRAAVGGCIHADPGVDMGSIAAMTWRVALLNASRNGVRFTPGSVEPELRFRFGPILADGRFLVLPHPFDGPPLAQPKSDLRRIGFLGHQRIEKGVEWIAPFAKALAADGYEVVVQNSNDDADRVVPAGIETLGYVEDIAALIGSCDLIVLPYAVDQYRRKGSGVLAHCMAIGVPVIAPLGTIPGQIIEQYGLGPLFPSVTGPAIYQAIRNVKQRYAAYADNAFRVAQQFSRRNGGAQFAAAFVALAEQSKA